jgi:hypothetical protein
MDVEFTPFTGAHTIVGESLVKFGGLLENLSS